MHMKGQKKYGRHAEATAKQGDRFGRLVRIMILYRSSVRARDNRIVSIHRLFYRETHRFVFAVAVFKVSFKVSALYT